MARSLPVPPPTSVLSDGVVVVRLRRASDLDAIAEASHDPETRRWLDDTPMDGEARGASMARVEEAWRSGRAAPLVVADAVTDAPVGIVNLQFRGDDVATVAYSVFPASRGRGVAPRAVGLLSGWALGELGLERLLIEVDEANAASLRVAVKCRFERVAARTGPDAEGGRRTTVVFARRAPRR
ncbi:GNAT family N-acetyltransferase [Streptomyces antarcticus]|uniref:GNAT family N-acetyltransferase n=1 Tax=Streptomyces antarcticus TaxID=2996458 RepID=UPI00226EC63A|nr:MULTISPECIES: GNAT family N-acetyltransferase [unclassified Streptomyces]MCY0947357.1 GNAT family N-acetyltransferase [Streptomyces sp. H34-AA3]MCZ4086472.1 GNAT family N-acetyltransferase [Streptomyces sp. H34-S5]